MAHSVIGGGNRNLHKPIVGQQPKIGIKFKTLMMIDTDYIDILPTIMVTMSPLEKLFKYH